MKNIARVAVSLLAAGALLGSSALTASFLTSSSAFAQTGSSGSVVVTTGQSRVGTVLFDGAGNALYMLSYDQVGTRSTAARSSCTGNCLGAWPPLLASGPSGPVVGQGGTLQPALGTTLSKDAQGRPVYQVTYFGHPLYRFLNDKAPGQTNGENVAAFNGIWNLVTVKGQPDAGVATVSLETSSYGSVLTSPTAFGGHRSLYALTTDPPNNSTCTGGCTRFWPPLLTTSLPIAGGGIDQSGLGTLVRDDGTLQVTYFGKPLHFFAFDLGPGAKSGLTNGEDSVDQFANGVWYLVSPSGASAPSPAVVGTMSSPLGPVLSFASNALYMFSGDASATGSACNALCSRIWTPLITGVAPAIIANSGLSQSALGTIQRSDGTTQVTYAGHPLYMFALDFSGTSGHNIRAFGGTFSLVTSTGTPAGGSPSPRPVVAIPELSVSGRGMSASFTVSFSSSSPGEARVLFGAGPGCSGLIESATQDSGSGTTEHRVSVSGNDLAGSGENSGIQMGATYSFEVVNMTGSGQQIDNNGGTCYTVTIPTS